MWPLTFSSFLSSKVIRYFDWVLIALSMLLGGLSGSYTLSSDIALRICLFHGIFFLASFLDPGGRSRRFLGLYVGLMILIFTSAASFSLSFPLQMYWFLVKSCLILRWRGAIITIILNGIGFLGAQYLDRYDALDLVSELGIERWLNPNAIFFRQLGFYLGGSSLMMVFALIILAEQKSRRQAESLTQQIRDLTARLERTRIAREIHDSLGHSLTTLDIQLELAQRLYRQDLAQSEQALRIAKDLTHQCINEVRRSVQTMRDPNFDLNHMIENLVDTIRQNQSVKIHLDLQLSSFPPHFGHQLYCIIQEGLTNIQRHAHATQVHLKGYQSPVDGMVQVILSDNGCGFIPESISSGFGLRGMQERAHILGGKLLLQSSSEEGTTLHIDIPYPREAI